MAASKEAFIIFERGNRLNPLAMGIATREQAVERCRKLWEREGGKRTLFVGPAHHHKGKRWTWAQFSAATPTQGGKEP